jgi:hypothetical protein
MLQKMLEMASCFMRLNPDQAKTKHVFVIRDVAVFVMRFSLKLGRRYTFFEATRRLGELAGQLTQPIQSGFEPTNPLLKRSAPHKMCA